MLDVMNGRHLLLALLLASTTFAAEIPPGLSVSFDSGKLGVTARDQSVRAIFEDIAAKAGFELVNGELLPEDRVSIILEPSPMRVEMANLLSLAPKLNYVVVYSEVGNPKSPVVRVSLFPREGNTGVVAVTGGSSGPSYVPPPQYNPPPLPPPPSLPTGNPSAPPGYQPPATTPVYIPPESPPVYIPPDAPPVYIPADGPPQYIPPAPPSGGQPNNP